MDIHASAGNAALDSTRIRTFNKDVWAWGLWDWGSAAFNAVVTTFVFAVYLTNAKLFGPDANRLLGYAMTIAGLFIALIAPALGQAVDRSGRRSTILRFTTLSTALIIACLFFVTPGQHGLMLGLVLLALGNIAFETGSVIYNALISDISAPHNVGRISGFGWGLGYLGGIVLLMILFVGFISPDVGWFGVTKEAGLNIRVAMLIAALWLLTASLPLLFRLKNKPARTDTPRLGVFEAYRQLFRSIAELWRHDRQVVWFLLSSAIYRDGLAGVFSFGAVLAGTAFGFAPNEVIIFGVATNVVAGIATISFGWLDDRIGARAVIIISLVSMVAMGMSVFLFHDGVAGLTPKQVYWVFGLVLCIFVGPIQSASRTYLARIAPPGEEAEIFGLYATTGRAVSPLAPFMYSTAITVGAGVMGIGVGEAAYFGILGITIVLVLGLLAFLPVKAQPKHQA
ncbi:MFS transporter [Trueperella pecoris]|uniref:MFS transporter n=1 Tax=Trueperella pecoris TaxID=2733571 RepID=UPI001ABEC93E|nr:MFS transporter [Trueperella pecoris]QTG75345.1 MFS transporter [Trueperella pecoris]